MAIGVLEAETFWVDFLRKLKQRALAGVKLVISDAHEGIKAAVARVFRATWQRCRGALHAPCPRHAGKSGRRVVSAFIATAFAQDHADAAKALWRQVADQVRPKLPKLAALLDEAEEDVLAYMSFLKEHQAKIHSTNPLERLNGEIKRAPRCSASSPPKRRSPACGAPSLGAKRRIGAAGPLHDPENDRAPCAMISPHAARRGCMNQSGPTRHKDPGRPTPTPRPGTQSRSGIPPVGISMTWQEPKSRSGTRLQSIATRS